MANTLNRLSAALGAAVALLSLAACGNDDEPEVPKGDYDSLTIELTADEQNVAQHNNAFAWELMDLVGNDMTRNVALSPMSASACLSMLANAAEGNSRSQLLQALGFADLPIDAVNSYNRKLTDNMCGLDPAVKLAVANSVWYAPMVNPKKAFMADMNEYYGIESYEINRATFVGDVNDWCAKKTKNLITKILEDDEVSIFSFINAIYFKGIWHHDYKFDKAKTKIGSFDNADGSQGSTSYMCAKQTYNYYCSDTWRAISIPFGGKGFRFAVILPDEGQTLRDILPSVKAEAHNVTRMSQYQRIDLELPKFKTYCASKLAGHLHDMGVTDIFDPSLADLSNLSDADIYVGMVKQHVSFEINEKGAEAAAVTIIDLDTSAGPVVDGYELFHVDRPFYYLISEQSSGSILFMGCQSNFHN